VSITELHDALVVRVTTTSGRIEITSDPAATTVRSVGGSVERSGSVTTVSSTAARLSIVVPERTHLVVGTTSGRVDVRGRAGAVSVLSTSASISIENAVSVDARSESGAIRIGQVLAECRAAASASRVEVERCGSAHVTTKSGRITLRSVHGPVRAHCISGRIEIAMATAADVDAETVSGRISVTVPKGVRARVMADRTQADVPEEFDCTVVVRSVSGRIDVSNR
jgi:DUF4097 and DUF4098 domain-containing protein YvlB